MLSFEQIYSLPNEWISSALEMNFSRKENPKSDRYKVISYFHVLDRLHTNDVRYFISPRFKQLYDDGNGNFDLIRKTIDVDNTSIVRMRRKRGEIVQDCDVYIGRSCYMGGWKLSQSKWHNPFTIKNYGLENCLVKYEEYIRSNVNLYNCLDELIGKKLGCWCYNSSEGRGDKPKCHGDILIKLLDEKLM
jgi:hypothetical protein